MSAKFDEIPSLPVLRKNQNIADGQTDGKTMRKRKHGLRGNKDRYLHFENRYGDIRCKTIKSDFLTHMTTLGIERPLLCAPCEGDGDILFLMRIPLAPASA